MEKEYDDWIEYVSQEVRDDIKLAEDEYEVMARDKVEIAEDTEFQDDSVSMYKYVRLYINGECGIKQYNTCMSILAKRRIDARFSEDV